MATKDSVVLRFTLPGFPGLTLGSHTGPSLGRRCHDVSQCLSSNIFWEYHLVDGETGFATHLSTSQPFIVGPKVGKSRMPETNGQIDKLGPLDFLVTLNQDVLRLCPLAGCQGAFLGTLVGKLTPYTGWGNRHDIEYRRRTLVKIEEMGRICREAEIW